MKTRFSNTRRTVTGLRLVIVSGLFLAAMSAALSQTAWYVTLYFTEVKTEFVRDLATLFYPAQSSKVYVQSDFQLYDKAPLLNSNRFNRPIVEILNEDGWNNPKDSGRAIVTTFWNAKDILELSASVVVVKYRDTRAMMNVFGYYETAHFPSWCELLLDKGDIDEYLREPGSVLHTFAAGDQAVMDDLVARMTRHLLDSARRKQIEVLTWSAVIVALLFLILLLDIVSFVIFAKRYGREHAVREYIHGSTIWQMRFQHRAELVAANAEREAVEAQVQKTRAEQTRAADALLTEAMPFGHCLDIDQIRNDLTDPTKFDGIRARIDKVKEQKAQGEREATWRTRAALAGDDVKCLMDEILKTPVAERRITPDELLHEAELLQKVGERFVALDEMFADPIRTDHTALVGLLGASGFGRAYRFFLRELEVKEKAREEYRMRKKQRDRA